MKKSKIIATLAATAVLSVGGVFALSGCSHTHTYAEEWSTDETHHWYAATCEHDNEKKDYGEHEYDDNLDVDCNVCGYVRNIISGIITAPGPNGGFKLAGAEISVANSTVKATADENGGYVISVSEDVQEVQLTVSHPACDTKTVTVDDIQSGLTTQNIQLVPKVLDEINKSYFELQEMSVSTKNDFVHETDTAFWETYGNVQTNHSEGLCLHIDNNESKEDMVSIIYQKIAITSSNSKMMFRARGFNVGSSDAAGLLAVRVVDVNGYSTADVTGEDGNVWQVMDSNGYVQFHYDLSAYEGKEVVIMIGAKQGTHNAIDRVRFIGKNENWVLPFTTAADLVNLPAEEAADIDGVAAIQAAFGSDSWIKVGGQDGINEGWRIKDAAYAEEGSTDYRSFVYRKLTFTNLNTIVVRARTFGGQNSVAGHSGQVYPELVLTIIDSNGNLVDIGGNCVMVTNENGCDDYYFSVDGPLNGDYTFALGIARGMVLAVEKVLFKTEAMVKGTVTGTIKSGTATIEGAKVSCGAESVVTGADGTFTIPVEIFSGNSLTLTVEKEGYAYSGGAITVSAEDIASGSKNLGDIALDRTIITGLTQSMIDALTAETATDINSISEIQSAMTNSWGHIGGNQSTANEGWLFKDAGYAEEGSTDIKVYAYKKLTFTNLNTIMVRARTFGGQNNIDGHGTVYPEIVIIIIDSAGNFVEIGGNCAMVTNENGCDDYYFAVDGPLNGDYTLVVGMARGLVLAVEKINFKTEAMVEGTVSGTVKSGNDVVEGAKITCGDTSVLSGADGTFSFPVLIFPGNSLTITVSKDGYAYSGDAITVSAEDIAEGSKNLGDIALDKTIITGLTMSMIDGMTANTGTSYTHNGGEGSNIDADWKTYGDIDHGHGEGTCIQVNPGTYPVSYLYAKFAITEENKYLSVSVREFLQGNGSNRDGEMHGQLQVKVIKADGTIEVVNLVSTLNVAADGKTLLNNSESYTVGVFDLSAYVGQTVVIIIQAVGEPEPITANQHNAINEIKFLGSYGSSEGEASGEED